MYRNKINWELKKENTTSVSHRGQQKKSQTNHQHQPHKTNHENLVKLQRTTENTTGLQSSTLGQVMNSSKKRFTKETFKPLNKNLNFAPTQTSFNYTKLNKKFLLKVHFKNHVSKARFTEDMFRKATNKNWVPNNRGTSIEIVMEATRN